MFGNKLKKISDNSENDKGSMVADKKKTENLVFFVVILIVTIVIINLILNGNKTVNKQENNSSSKKLATTIEGEVKNAESENTDIEKQLETILSKIQGVGDVKVFINYSESSEVVAMYNENTKVSNTEENDTSGGTRKIQQTDSQKDIIYKEQNGEKMPITQKIMQPKMEGAIITAKGATNAETKANIIQAVEAVTGLASHKIQVFEMN